MWNACQICGAYRVDKTIDKDGPRAICPECGHKHPFRYLPLFVVGGASGTGKSTVCNQMAGRELDLVFLDSDILWRSEFNQPENNYRGFFDTWLRLCKNINQSGRPCLLFGAGFGVPENLETSLERRYFSKIAYLALVCTPEILAERLENRPAWRKATNPNFIREQLDFNQWFIDYHKKGKEPPIKIVDTSQEELQLTVSEIQAWVSRIITESGC